MAETTAVRYHREPPDLPSQCDGCGGKFTLRHALACKKGALVLIRHDEVRDELANLAARALTPSRVRDEPSIYPSRSCAPSTASQQPTSPVRRNLQKTAGDERGDISIRGLWSRGVDCIIDVRVTDTDAKSYKDQDPSKVLANQEREKKRKYLNLLLDQHKHFTPFVVSVDGLIGKEAHTLVKKLAELLAEKTGKPYSQCCNFVRTRISIAIARATHLCLRGTRAPRQPRYPQWEDGAGLRLFFRN